MTKGEHKFTVEEINNVNSDLVHIKKVKWTNTLMKWILEWKGG